MLKMNKRSATKFDVKVGRIIKKKRQQLGISMHQLADAIGVTYQQVQKYENGTNRISLSRANDICKFLGVNISDLVV